eukprot:UN12357
MIIGKISLDLELFENHKRWDNRFPDLQVVGTPSKKCEKYT